MHEMYQLRYAGLPVSYEHCKALDGTPQKSDKQSSQQLGINRSTWAPGIKKPNFILLPIEEMPTPSHQLHDIVFDPIEVYIIMYKEFSSLDTSKAMGCDNLHPALLKMSALLYTTCFNTFWSLCLSTGSLPKEWKVHKIVLIPEI